MKYFFVVEHGSNGDARALLGSEQTFRDFYGERHPALFEVAFDGPDAFKGEPPPDHFLYVYPRKTLLEELATPFIRMEAPEHE